MQRFGRVEPSARSNIAPEFSIDAEHARNSGQSKGCHFSWASFCATCHTFISTSDYLKDNLWLYYLDLRIYLSHQDPKPRNKG